MVYGILRRAPGVTTLQRDDFAIFDEAANTTAALNRTTMPRPHDPHQADFAIFADDAYPLAVGNRYSNLYDIAIMSIIRMAGSTPNNDHVVRWAELFVERHWESGDENEVLNLSSQPGDTPEQYRRRLRHFRRRIFANDLHAERWGNANEVLVMPDYHVDLLRLRLVDQHTDRDFHDIVRRQTDLDIVETALDTTGLLPREALFDRERIPSSMNILRSIWAHQHRFFQELPGNMDHVNVDVDEDEHQLQRPEPIVDRHITQQLGRISL